jgi:hypothetical protein
MVLTSAGLGYPTFLEYRKKVCENDCRKISFRCKKEVLIEMMESRGRLAVDLGK